MQFATSLKGNNIILSCQACYELDFLSTNFPHKIITCSDSAMLREVPRDAIVSCNSNEEVQDEAVSQKPVTEVDINTMDLNDISSIIHLVWTPLLGRGYTPRQDNH